jgi:hypothetical protein
MPIRLVCVCGKRFSVKDQYAGKKIKCPQCGEATVMPTPEVDSQHAAAVESAAPPAPGVFTNVNEWLRTHYVLGIWILIIAYFGGTILGGIIAAVGLTTLGQIVAVGSLGFVIALFAHAYSHAPKPVSISKEPLQTDFQKETAELLKQMPIVNMKDHVVWYTGEDQWKSNTYFSELPSYGAVRLARTIASKMQGERRIEWRDTHNGKELEIPSFTTKPTRVRVIRLADDEFKVWRVFGDGSSGPW